MKRNVLSIDKVKNESLYLKTHLAQALKKEGLPFSKPTLLILEIKNVLPKPDFELTNPNIDKKPWRIFLGSTIIKAVKRVREYYK